MSRCGKSLLRACGGWSYSSQRLLRSGGRNSLARLSPNWAADCRSLLSGSHRLEALLRLNLLDWLAVLDRRDRLNGNDGLNRDDRLHMADDRLHLSVDGTSVGVSAEASRAAVTAGRRGGESGRNAGGGNSGGHQESA